MYEKNCMESLIKVSRYAGMREDLVQANGGNSSVKIDEEKMYIKSSGVQLADVSSGYGYSLINYQIIRHFFEGNDLSNCSQGELNDVLNEAYIEGGKPSIETFIHALSDICTLHTHPIIVNAIVCRKDWDSIIKTLFPEAITIPYASPGVELAKLYFDKYYIAEKKTKVVFLQNHGLVVSGKNPEEVIQMTEDVTKTVERFLHIDYSYYHIATLLSRYIPARIVWAVTDQEILSFFNNNDDWDLGISPDCVVYLGEKVCELKPGDIEKSIQKFREKYSLLSIIKYNNFIYLCADSVKMAYEMQSLLQFSIKVKKINEQRYINTIDEKEKFFLLNWEAEKYRRDN